MPSFIWYIGRRILENALLLVFLALAMFVLFRLVPADPVTTIVSPELDAEARARVIQEWGLDGSIPQQLWEYLRGLLSLDFGQSFQYRKPVFDILADKFVNTIILVVPAVLIASVAGLLLGLRAGLRPNGITDHLTIWLPPVLRGIPVFWLGILLLMLFSYGLDWLPIAGMRAIGASATTFAEKYLTLDFLRHLILPVASLAITSLPEPILLMRQSVRGVLREDFVSYLAMRGLPDSNLSRHVFWNSSLPVLTWVFHMFGYTLSTTIVVEIIFAWPGLGREMANAVLSYDYPLAQGAFFLIAVIVVALNLILDLIYPLIDPRIARPGGEQS
jgi:peptide/nickel transport system permease protein